MPAKFKSKSKSVLIGWITCDLCGSLICCRRNFDIHRSNDCSVHKPFMPSGVSLNQLRYGFIRGGTLMASVEFQKDQDAHAAAPHASHKLLCLHPLTMSELSLSLMSPVVINQRYILYAWPDVSLSLSAVRVTERLKNLLQALTSYISVRALDLRQVQHDAQVQLSLRDFSVHKPPLSLINFISKEYEYLPFGADFSVTYLGVTYTLYVAATMAEVSSTNTLLSQSFTTSLKVETPRDENNLKENANETELERNACKNSLNDENTAGDISAVCDSMSNMNISNRSGRDLDQSADIILESLASKADISGLSNSISDTIITSPQPLFSEETVRWIHIASKTVVSIYQSVTRSVSEAWTLDDVGGYAGVKDTLLKMAGLVKCAACDLSSKQLVQYDMVPRSALLFGPAGTGKTLLVKAIASTTGLALLAPDQQLCCSRYSGEAVIYLGQFFSDVRLCAAPCIVFLDTLDALCPNQSGVRTGGGEGLSLAECLCTEINGLLSARRDVLVLSATSKLSEISVWMREAGCAGVELELGVPSVGERCEILRRQMHRLKHSLTDCEIEGVAHRAHGYVAADLLAVCNQANSLCASRNESVITCDHMTSALSYVVPSAMREIAIERPTVSWSDIAIPSSLRLQLSQCIDWPQQHAQIFTRFGVSPPRGILLYGPPGCSKTMIAKAVARDSGLNFISIKAGELLGKWVGDSERAIREVFRKARTAAPSVLFFDEIDALASHRGKSGSEAGGVSDRVVAQLLSEMSGVDPLTNVIIIAATNRPDHVDEAIKRAGRFDRVVYVPLPDATTRLNIFHIHFSRMPPLAQDVDLQWLVQKTSGFSGSEVVTLIKEAFLHALRSDPHTDRLCKADFTAALALVEPETSADDVLFYEQYCLRQRSKC